MKLEDVNVESLKELKIYCKGQFCGHCSHLTKTYYTSPDSADRRCGAIKELREYLIGSFEISSPSSWKDEMIEQIAKAKMLKDFKILR